MSSDFHTQLHHQFNQRDTDELLTIWQENNRGDWSETAFEVIREILQERLGQVPPQNAPTFERTTPQEPPDPAGQLLEREAKPVFYSPKEVFWLIKWLERLSIAAVVATIVLSISWISTMHALISGFFTNGDEPKMLVWTLTFLLLAVDVALQCVLYYFGFRWLAFILQMLIEIEFRSRKLL